MSPMNEMEPMLSPEDLLAIQVKAKAEGRCGSLQTASGMPCLRWPKTGYPVCRKHGERAPQTVAKAERLLAVARMPAIQVMLDICEMWDLDTCDSCGYPRRDTEEKRVYLQAAKLVLDRTGLGPRSTIDLNARRSDDGEVNVEQMTDGERERLEGLVTQLAALKAEIRARLAGQVPVDVIEGHLLTSVVEKQSADS